MDHSMNWITGGGSMMFLWWIFIIGGIVFLVKWIAQTSRSNPDKSALDILKGRYARGEISKEEFERMKADLQ